MINLMRLVKFTKKWKKLAAPERKRISIPRSGEDENTDNNDRLPVANKGHFVVYTVDQRRFEFPFRILTITSLENSWQCLRKSLACRELVL
jgi:hypothetical protein